VEAGTWSEVEGLRAVVSVVMGERLPESIPALEELPKFHYAEVVDRAIEFLDGTDADDVPARDLARLISFFIADDSSADSSEDGNGDAVDTTETGSSTGDTEGAYGDATSFAPVGLRSAFPRQAGCERPQEVVLYSAEQTLVCYEKFEDGDDVVYIPIHADAIDISDRIFSIIQSARPGYDSLAARELQPVNVLVSLNPSPAEPETSATPAVPRGDAIAHVASRSGSLCRVAIFASSTLAMGGPELSFTIAHELFHCIQGQWGGSAPDFVEEGGADYFAYELLGQMCTAEQVGLGAKLDSATTSESLLNSSYEGWFFWAYLSERGYLPAQQIASLHKGIYGGGDPGSAIADSLDDAPKVLNEFYARLVGPGLACDFQGSKFTSTVQIAAKGPVELNVSDIWVGTRYELQYEEEFLFEQSSNGSGPIGMAELDKRSSEGEWVTVEPEVRTTCIDKKKWAVVVSPPDANSSAASPLILEIDAARPGGCDPCVIGSWSVDMDTYGKFMETFGEGLDLQLLGTYIFHFAGGPPDESFEFADERNITISIAEGAGVSFNIAGNGQGTYTALNGRLEVAGYADAGTASVTGVPLQASVPFANTGGGGAPFTCEDDDLEILLNGGTITATRMPSTPKGPAYFS